jgi:hypothetical protein
MGGVGPSPVSGTVRVPGGQAATHRGPPCRPTAAPGWVHQAGRSGSKNANEQSMVGGQLDRGPLDRLPQYFFGARVCIVPSSRGRRKRVCEAGRWQSSVPLCEPQVPPYSITSTLSPLRPGRADPGGGSGRHRTAHCRPRRRVW